jgi:hypothetical protein
MIIFDLDGVLADCEHRRHLVDRDKAAEKGICYEEVEYTFGGVQNGPWVLSNDSDRLWKPDWKAYYEACDKDEPIKQAMKIIKCMFGWDYYARQEDVHIWTDRCESVRLKTEKWLDENSLYYMKLKMRPLGNTDPVEVLKEKWLDEICTMQEVFCGEREVHNVEMVFDAHPESIAMWKRRGVFVFDCRQEE